jgi:hypothetical protein
MLDACSLQLVASRPQGNGPGSSIQPEVMSIHQIVAGCDKNVQHIFFHYDRLWQTTER